MKQNIIWITIDSLRADHTSLHGYKRNTTPEMSRIASLSSGINFKNATSCGIATPISVPSILTGVYPSRHQSIGENWDSRVPEDIHTIPEEFAENGYQTICISENEWVGEAKNLDTRFDSYVNAPPSLSDHLSIDRISTLVKYLLSTSKHGPGLSINRHAHGDQTSFFTKEMIKTRLNQIDESKPVFHYYHFNDTHLAYLPPKEYISEIVSEFDATSDELLTFAREIHDNIDKSIADRLPLSNREYKMLVAMYDAVIKYVDYCIGDLFDYIIDSFPEAIVVITSDHGDLFGEKGVLGHSHLTHDGLIHVPLITYGLDNITHQATNPVQHIDIMKTLISKAGLSNTQFQGRDLQTDRRDIAISQHLSASVDDDTVKNYEGILQYDPEFDVSDFHESLLTCARTPEFKLEYTEEFTRLYMLPDETRDVKSEYPGVHDELEKHVIDWLETQGQPLNADYQTANLTEETRTQLQDMGYMV